MLGAMLRRRHLLLGISGSETCDHLTFIRLSGHDAVRSTFQGFESEFTAGKDQAAFGIIRAVAFEAMLGEEGLDVARKIDGGSVEARDKQNERAKTQNGHAG
jgi:hypothetical protein